MTVAEAISDLMTRSGLSKSELCARSGVSRSLLDDYLKGRRQPAVAQLERLGEAAGLRLDVVWRELDIKAAPAWARPHPSMNALPLTVAERSKVLELVVPVAMEMRRRPRGELAFPPFRTLRKVAKDAS